MITITIAEAQTYFDSNLFAAPWDDASAAKKQQALDHAARDIGTLNYSRTTPRARLIDAVCEQALFLLTITHAERQRARMQALGVTDLRVEGASESYRAGAGLLIAPQARAALDGYLHRRIGRIV